MKVVLDTNVVVSGIIWGGLPKRVLLSTEADHVERFASLRTLGELGKVLRRPKFEQRLERHGIKPLVAVEAYARECQIVAAPPLPEPIAPDPDDDWVIATAIAANADLIVTGDKPFLSVATVGTIKIVSVHDALALISAARSP